MSFSGKNAMFSEMKFLSDRVSTGSNTKHLLKEGLTDGELLEYLIARRVVMALWYRLKLIKYYKLTQLFVKLVGKLLFEANL